MVEARDRGLARVRRLPGEDAARDPVGGARAGVVTRAAVYVAGPGGFDAGGRRWHAHVCAALAREGYEVLDPWRASAALFDDASSRHGDARIDALRLANHT